MRLLLRLYPDRFRRRFAADLEELVVRQALGTLNDRGKLAFFHFVVKCHASLGVGALYERRAARCRFPSNRRGRFMYGVLADVSSAARNLRRSAPTTLLVLLLLSIGIGANVAIFSMIYAVVLRPLPFPDAERLVAVRDIQPPNQATPASFPELLSWREQEALFDEIGFYFNTVDTLTEAGAPEDLAGIRVSASLAAMLGVRPILGRLLTSDEELAGAEPAVMISRSLWQRRFGGDTEVIGRTILLSGAPHRIVGVLPDDIELPFAADADFWTGHRLTVAAAGQGLHLLQVVARLREGLDLAGARERVPAIVDRLQRASQHEHGMTLVPLLDRIVGDSAVPLLLLQVGIALVLLIACTNVASLLLVQALGRAEELGVRMALGASRWRIVRLLLTEGAVLGALGAVAGLAMAALLLDSLVALSPERLPRSDEIGIDVIVVAVTLTVALVSGLLCALTPALTASRQTISQALRRSGMAARHRGTRFALVVGEVALTTVLVVSAGLLLRSFADLVTRERAFGSDGILTFEIGLPSQRYPDVASRLGLFDDLLRALRGSGLVAAAGAATDLPLGGGSPYGRVGIDGYPEDSPPPIANKVIVTPGYFETLGIDVLRGRSFHDDDREGSPPVAIVNQEFARRFLRDGQLLGRPVDFSWGTEGNQQIVGVVADVPSARLELAPEPSIYVPLAQRSISRLYFVVKGVGAPLDLVDSVRERVWSADPDLPVSVLRTMEDIVSEAVTMPRFRALLAGLFAASALILATAGLYGVVAHSVRQRHREIGLRIALGAGPKAILALVVRQGAFVASVGIGLGLVAALASTRWLGSMLFDVGGLDPVTFGGAGALLFAVALFASWIPAHRAVRVDPVTALRRP